MELSSKEHFKAYVGIDWADKKHDICLQPADSNSREFTNILHTAEAIDEWAKKLHKRFKGPIAVAVELSKGPIVYALQKYDFIVVFPIDPTKLARYRVAFKPSRAKDDPTDAEFALDLMCRYPDKFKPLRQQGSEVRKLMYLVEQRRKFVDDKRRFSNRLINTLKQYYPQILDWFAHRDTLLFCNFIIRWPSLQKIKRSRESTIVDFFHANNGRSRVRIEQCLKATKESMPLMHIPNETDHSLQAKLITFCN